jgi:hypothetical protein
MVRRPLASTVLAAGLAVAAPAPAARAAGEPTMPLGQVKPGMRCTARSVLRGATVSTFSADVIGILDGSLISGAREVHLRVVKG